MLSYEDVIAEVAEHSDTDEVIRRLEAKINGLQLAASQAAQNQYLINELRSAPVSSYPTSNLYGYMNCGGHLDAVNM